MAKFECAPRSQEWSATGAVSRGPRGLVISRIEFLAPESTASGITGSVLRKIQIGEILHLVRASITLASQGTAAEEDAPHGAGSARTGGRAKLSQELLRNVAVAYLAETAPGQPPGAVKRMAREFGRPEETIRSWIARSRSAGWLGPSVKGRAGAEPGPHLRDLSPEEFTRIFADAYDSPPQSLAELAAGIPGLPKDRARAASVAWFTPARQADLNRQTLEWEQQEQERLGEQDVSEEQS